MKRRSGFTLVEVMMAVAILALSLSAIFSSEAGAARMANRSHKMGIAALMARCKMGEIEEQVAAEGLPALFDSGSDACCDGAEVEGFSCDWEMDPIVLPDAMFPSDTGDDTTGAAAPADQAAATATALGAPPGSVPGADPTAASPLGALSDSQPQDLLSGGDLDGIGAIALQTAYPVLKPSFESQIRRATVTVHWKEGSSDHSFDVTQYLVSEQAIATPETQDTTTGPGASAPVAPTPGL